MTQPYVIAYDPARFHMLPADVTDEQVEQFPYVVTLSPERYLEAFDDQAIPEATYVHTQLDEGKANETFMGYKLCMIEEQVIVRFANKPDAVIFKLVWGGDA